MLNAYKYAMQTFIFVLLFCTSNAFSAVNINSIDINTLPDTEDGRVGRLVRYNEYFYTIVNYANSGSAYTSLLFLFDPKKNSSELIDISPVGPRDIAELAIYNDKLYLNANLYNGKGEEFYEYDIKNKSTRLAADIDPDHGSDPSYFTVYNQKLYFSAYNKGTGREIYEYNYQTDTTRLVADINPGSASSSPWNFKVYNNKLYFSAFNEVNGTELYEYNDITGTTLLVDDINEGANSSRPINLTLYQNKLYFFAYNETIGSALYKYDDSTGKINLVADINPSTSHQYDSNLDVYDNKLYFSVDDGINGEELYEYDGTSNTSRLVADTRTGSKSSSPNSLYVFNNKLYFSAYNETTGREMYEFDSELNSTKLFQDITPGENWYGPASFSAYGEKLYFINKGELHFYDSLKSEVSFTCVRCKPQSSRPENLTHYDGKLYFFAYIGSGYDKGLYAYNNATNTTELVSELDINTNGGMVVYNNQLYFSAWNDVHRSELYVFNSQDNSVSLVADIDPSQYKIYKNKLCFIANNGINGDELYEYNDINNSMRLVADINPGPNSGLSRYGSDLFVYNQKLFFSADNGTTGQELFFYDDKIGTVQLAADINPGSQGSNPHSFVFYRSLMFFSANNGVNGDELYAYNSETNKASLVIDNYTGDDYYKSNNSATGPTGLTVFNNKLYYQGYLSGGGYELFEYDGASYQIRLVAEINSGTYSNLWDSGLNNSNPSGFKVYKNKLYFSASNSQTGTELYLYDSEADAVSLVADLNTGKEYMERQVYAKSGYPIDLTVYDDKLFFIAEDSLIGRELFNLHDDGNSEPLIDTDGDGLANNTDLDDDNDGIPDTWEIAFGLNPLDASDALMDTDNDGISNVKEYQLGSNPQNGNEDADGDGYSNFDEHLVGSDPLNKNDIPANINSWIGILLNSQKPSQLNKH